MAAVSAARVQQIKDIFKRYDANGDGSLSLDELQSVLRAVGMFQTTEIRTVFQRIDRNGDGRLDVEEFVDWLFTPPDQDARAKAALLPGSEMQSVFFSFCGSGQKEMDGKSFAKLCKDSNLVDKTYSTTDIDIIFAKVVRKGMRRISYDEYEKALSLIAQKKRVDLQELKERILTNGAPVLKGTHADAVRFHDDKSTYTGAQAKVALEMKGPAPRSPSPHTLAAPGVAPLLRSRPGSAASGGRAKASGSSPLAAAGTATLLRSAGTTSTPSLQRVSSGAGLAKDGDGGGGGGGGGGTLLEAFKNFCRPNAEMDGKTFVKVCKDSGLMDKLLTGTDLDLVFAKVVCKGQRRIGFHQFEDALGLVGSKKSMDPAAVQAKVAACGGPVLSGTQTEAVRFHDDKSTYTGTHINGGPESVPKGEGSATQLASRNMRLSQR